MHRLSITSNHAGGNCPRTTALLTAVTPRPTAAAMVRRPSVSAMSAAVVMAPKHPQNLDAIKSKYQSLRVTSLQERKMPQIASRNDRLMGEKQYRDIGARLRAFRISCSREGEPQRDFAERHGFTATAWNNWESGHGRITVDAAIALCRIYGLTLDWIYLGRRDGLSENIRNRL